MVTILLAEDDTTDAELFYRAVKRSGEICRLFVVDDGEKVLSYLRGEGQFANRDEYPFPDLLFLDLKMPVKTGFAVLEWLRGNSDFCVMPTIVLTASDMEQDVIRAYRLGANSYLVKPDDFHALVDLVQLTIRYWQRNRRPKLRSLHLEAHVA